MTANTQKFAETMWPTLFAEKSRFTKAFGFFLSYIKHITDKKELAGQLSLLSGLRELSESFLACSFKKHYILTGKNCHSLKSCSLYIGYGVILADDYG
mgnify:CR=1 FL=1